MGSRDSGFRATRRRLRISEPARKLRTAYSLRCSTHWGHPKTKRRCRLTRIFHRCSVGQMLQMPLPSLSHHTAVKFHLHQDVRIRASMRYVILLSSLSLLGCNPDKSASLHSILQDVRSFTQSGPSNTVYLRGIILSDRLHTSFRLPQCEDKRVPVLYDMTSEKNDSLRAYQERIRSSRTGFVEYPIILIGLFEATEGGGLVFRATDFREAE